MTWSMVVLLSLILIVIKACHVSNSIVMFFLLVFILSLYHDIVVVHLSVILILLLLWFCFAFGSLFLKVGSR
jgi:hypothetical protein